MNKINPANFIKKEIIGRGSFGTVYKCLNKLTGEEVAIKEVDLDDNDDELEDIQREIDMLRACESKYVIKYYGSCFVGTKLLIVMEYMDGGSVKEVISVCPMKEKCISIIIREILSALEFIHRSRKIHCDIKSANILLNSNGDVKLADFGVASSIECRNKAFSFAGTPFWMAPEVIQESGYNEKCDIWSLGITAIEIANGKPPYYEMTPQKVISLIPQNAPPSLEGDFSPHFKDFVRHCLVKDPSERPSAQQLLLHPFVNSIHAKNKKILADYVVEIKPRLKIIIDDEPQVVISHNGNFKQAKNDFKNKRKRKRKNGKKFNGDDQNDQKISVENESFLDDESDDKNDCQIEWNFPSFEISALKRSENECLNALEMIEGGILSLQRDPKFKDIKDSLIHIKALLVKCNSIIPTFASEFVAELNSSQNSDE